MKVVLITLHAVKNYGSALQAFATQEILKKHGCQVEIINYVREDVQNEKLIKNWSQGNIAKRIIITPTIKKSIKVFEKFYSTYLNLTDRIYISEDDFINFSLDGDMYCTGSDQVWNSKWNKGIINPLYLSFVPKSKFKFAFSASFGQNVLEENEILLTKHLIDEYQFISTREDSGKRILQEQYGYKKAIQTIDPTLILTADEWRKFEPESKIDKDYILVYNLNRNSEFDRYAVKLAKKTGLKLVRFCTRYDQFYRPGKSIFIPEVVEFIELIDHAKYVLTDSFHATAFSMNMNTQPICVYPPEFSSRIESFLNLTDSLHRHIKNYDDFDVVNRPVDFEKVNAILDCERKKANNYLDKVLSAANNFYS